MKKLFYLLLAGLGLIWFINHTAYQEGPVLESRTEITKPQYQGEITLYRITAKGEQSRHAKILTQIREDRMVSHTDVLNIEEYLAQLQRYDSSVWYQGAVRKIYDRTGN